MGTTMGIHALHISVSKHCIKLKLYAAYKAAVQPQFYAAFEAEVQNFLFND